MRLFTAVDIPSSRLFDHLHDELASVGRTLRPVPPENLHITLKFIGDPGCGEAEVISALGEVGKEIEPFEMRVEVAGCFPSWKRPSILWVSFGNDERLVELAKEIDRVLHSRIDTPLETREYRTHLTLARVKGRTDPSKLKLILEETVSRLKEEDYVVPVNAFHLYSSTLTPQGPIYRRLSSHPLGQNVK